MSETNEKKLKIEKLRKQEDKLTILMLSLFKKHVDPSLKTMRDEYHQNRMFLEDSIDMTNKELSVLTSRRDKLESENKKLTIRRYKLVSDYKKLTSRRDKLVSDYKKLTSRRDKLVSDYKKLDNIDIEEIINNTKKKLLISKKTKNKYTNNLKTLMHKRSQIRYKISRLNSGRRLAKETDSPTLNVSVSPPGKKSGSPTRKKSASPAGKRYASPTRKKSALPAGKKSGSPTRKNSPSPSPSRNSKTSKRR